MRWIAPLAGAAVVVLALAGPARAQTKDPAELFPAQTLAYLEVRQPDRLTRELAGLIKGSSLEDMAATLAAARTKRGDRPDDFFFGDELLAAFAMLLSPEGLAEYGRIGGGAVAITGWNKDDGPEIVGVIFPGDCNLVPLYLKTYLAMDREIRILDKVEGVNLYRARGRDYRIATPFEDKPGGAPPPQPPIKDKGPTFALLPGMAVIASTPAAAKEVVRRAKGKVAEPALSSVAAFKPAAKLRDKPGLFAYADVAALSAQLDEATKQKPNADWITAKALLNPRALGPVVATLTLQNGGLDFHAQVQVDPKQPCPLLELLPDKKAALDGLHFAPKDGLLTVTLPLPDGAKRWEKLVALLDTVARARGEPDLLLPGKVIAEMESQAGLRLGNDVFAKVAGITLTLDASGVNGFTIRGLALTATDADAAKALEDVVPKVAGMVGVTAAPGAEKVQGLTIRSIGEDKAHYGKWYYGREDKTLVLAHAKEAVAGALLGGAKGGGLLGDAKAAAVLKETNGATAVGALSLGQSLIETVKAAESGSGRPGVKGEVKPPPPPPGAPPGGDKPPKDKEDVGAKLMKELERAVEPLPPAVLTLSRKGDLFVLEMKQTALKTVSAKVINALVDKAVHDLMSGRGNRFGPGAIDESPRDTIPEVPPPPGKP
jgi:hypothetical protein